MEDLICIPYKLDFETQQYALTRVLKFGHRTHGVSALTIRGVDLKGLPPELKYWHDTDPFFHANYRLTPEVEWRWIFEDEGMIEIGNRLIKDVSSFFTKITRIKINVLHKGGEVGVHRDFCSGQKYPSLTRWGEEALNDYTPDIYDRELKGPFLWNDNLSNDCRFADEIYPLAREGHSDQNYYSLKIPISENPKSQGKPFYYTPEKEKIIFNSNFNSYFLNDFCLHGADSVDFYRGLFWIDGFINEKGLAKIEASKIPVIV